MNEEYIQRLREFGDRLPEGVGYEPRSISELDFLEPEDPRPMLPERLSLREMRRLSNIDIELNVEPPKLND